MKQNDVCRDLQAGSFQCVTIKESPEWLKKRLRSVGLNPKNNIVGITNYVMFETGQPLHAFDYDKINGKEIIVKKAKDGDKFMTLDGKKES
ncbi:MAG: B3/4 domain-containing protein [Ignavibacteria bacterium]